WGCSLGKRWLRLRVYTAGGADAPGLGRALVRTLGLYACMLPTDINELVQMEDWRMGFVLPASALLTLGLITCTMRRGNGYRGPYELLSGTRVVQLPEPDATDDLPIRMADRAPPSPASTNEMPERVGPFRVLGIMRGSDSAGVLLAEDTRLGRKVWL